MNLLLFVVCCQPLSQLTSNFIAPVFHRTYFGTDEKSLKHKFRGYRLLTGRAYLHSIRGLYLALASSVTRGMTRRYRHEPLRAAHLTRRKSILVRRQCRKRPADRLHFNGERRDHRPSESARNCTGLCGSVCWTPGEVLGPSHAKESTTVRNT